MARRTVSNYLGVPTASAAKAPSRALVPTGVPAVPPDGAAALAAELNDLTRTLDVLATIVASVSDRVDSQTAALGKLTGTVAEARQAAFAARAQTDPGRVASEVEQAVSATLLPHLRELVAATAEVSRTARGHDSVGQLKGQVADLSHNLRRERERAALWQARLPGIGAAALLLVLALLVLMPRFAADHPATCRLMGGEWRDYTEWGDGTSCEFDRP